MGKKKKFFYPELTDSFSPNSSIPLNPNVPAVVSSGKDDLAVRIIPGTISGLDELQLSSLSSHHKGEASISLLQDMASGSQCSHGTKSSWPWVLQIARRLLGVLGDTLVGVSYETATGFLTDNNAGRNASRITSSHGWKEYDLVSSLGQFNNLRYHPTGRGCVGHDFEANQHEENNLVQSTSGLQNRSVEPENHPDTFEVPPFEPIMERCQLCGMDLCHDPQDYTVLSCGHRVHTSCLKVIYGPHEPSQVPPCIHC